MGVNWLSYITFVWVMITILGSVLDQAFGSAAESALEAVLQFNLFDFKEIDVFFANIKVPLPNLDYLANLASLVLWDWSFLAGDYALVRWIVYLPLTGGMIFLLVTSIGPSLMAVVVQARRAILGG